MRLPYPSVSIRSNGGSKLDHFAGLQSFGHVVQTQGDALSFLARGIGSKDEQPIGDVIINLRRSQPAPLVNLFLARFVELAEHQQVLGAVCRSVLLQQPSALAIELYLQGKATSDIDDLGFFDLGLADERGLVDGKLDWALAINLGRYSSSHRVGFGLEVKTKAGHDFFVLPRGCFATRRQAAEQQRAHEIEIESMTANSHSALPKLNSDWTVHKNEQTIQ